MQEGDAVFFTHRHLEHHLWIIVSDPRRDPLHVVIANLTTYNILTTESACLLYPGDYPFIKHATAVHFDKCCMTSDS